jgi:hypothetical protein
MASWTELLDQRSSRQTPFDEEVRRRVEALADTVTQQHLLTVAVPHNVHNVVQHLGESR